MKFDDYDFTPEQRELAEKIELAAESVLYRLGESRLGDRVILSFEKRFVRTIAQCMTTANATRLRFQWPLWRFLNEEEQMETVAHETCHLVQESRWPNGSSPAHGIEWKSLMRCVGYQNAQPEGRLNPVAHAMVLSRIKKE